MEKSSLGELPVLQAKISGKTTRQTATRLAGRDDDDDVFGRGLVSFHTPPVSRLLFCGPLPYSVSRERMNGDEFGQHKEEEEYFLAPFFFLTNGQEDWGYCRTGERIYFFFKAVCLFRSCVCSVVLSFVVSVFGVVCGYPRHASVQVEGALLWGSLICPVDCVNSLRGPATIFVLCWKERNKQ
jgi:hypothetical protein